GVCLPPLRISTQPSSLSPFELRITSGGWSPLTSDRYQWLQVDLGERTKITAVATQGRYGSSDWLTTYLLMFSDMGHNWKQYRQEDSIGSFSGNSNADSVVQYKLQQPAMARFLRLIPLDWNPSGRIGLRLEAYGCPYSSDVVSFDGSSCLLYRLTAGSRRTSTSVVTLKFKTMRNSGTILQVKRSDGLSLNLELERGKLLLLLRRGRTLSTETRHLASLGSLLDDQHWHHVTLELHSLHVNLTVDKLTKRVQIPTELHHLDIDELSFGAVESLLQKTIISSRNFHGCLENLQFNGLNLLELAKVNDHRVAAGNLTFSCVEPNSVAVTFSDPHSFLQLPWATASSSEGASVEFQFRTWNKAGLLLTFDLPQQGGVVWFYLSESHCARPAVCALTEHLTCSALSDGQWHSVELNSRRGHLSISVDKEEGGSAQASPSFPVAVESQLFFGGCPTEDRQESKDHLDTFYGCMRSITLDTNIVDLILVQQRQLGNYSNLQIDMCGIIDRCSPSRCEHGGCCSQSWTNFHCNCSDSGYSGATCHSSVHEPSCEAYKHNGNTSGYFYIDVDGSGPIKPQLVYCNMTETDTWMILQHNNTELTRIRPSPGVDQLSVHFGYLSEEEQLLTAISQSEHCEQELSYHCRKSRLHNTSEGSPFSWWLGGPGSGRVHTHWGGAHPDSQQCSCGLQGDCDSGLLTHKESLPVRALVLGDVQRPGSEAAYRVGPVHCYGDKNFWNAASFDKQTSYLHFPTFHGELSADISFLFKTTTSSGVFLENLGIKDFIRIELSSSTWVVFSFDVGNGPLEVKVESRVPLDDGRWHRVRAERNIKEASLQLDDLPVATQQAPTDGHVHLQLNSQLFIGGTASRQGGFRGCIRSLKLNGATLDLEERAKITPGVRPGCPGHCSSYGPLCQNQGRCVEKPSGFSCDCSSSAYTGIFCQTELSGSFKAGTSIRYSFKDPYEWSRNSSHLPSSIYSDSTPRGENISLSFRTTQSPALLLYISSFYRGHLEVRYKLDSSRDAEVLRSGVRGMANGHLHSVSIRRQTHTVSMQVREISPTCVYLNTLSTFKIKSDDLDPHLTRVASLGFTGCLSVVQFNSINPLKAALLHPDSSPVVITGPLAQSNCDQSDSVGSGQPLVNAFRTDSALIGGVIAVVIFVIVSALAVTARYLYHRKDTYRNQEGKQVKQEDSPDFPFNNQMDSQNRSTESTKEYFI
uniref:Contactin associated protein like 3 n=1 Tax=Nothobranchius furzeri TaxID=105023 RepID=A0A8C6PDK8_NOTFU